MTQINATPITVDLVDHLGDDLAIVNAARVSFHKQARRDEAGALSAADQGLIGYLARNRHGTPFEQVVFSFRIRCPIFVGREILRHRMASPNEESGRYVELRPDFYVHPLLDIRAQVGKPGAYTFAPLDYRIAKEAQALEELAYNFTYETYERQLGLGVAKEVARAVLPVGIMTELIFTLNLRSMTNFLSLRTDPTALLEIRYVAQAMEPHVAAIVPVAYQAWVAGGRQPL